MNQMVANDTRSLIRVYEFYGNRMCLSTRQAGTVEVPAEILIFFTEGGEILERPLLGQEVHKH